MATQSLNREQVVEMVDKMPAFPESVQQVLELTGDINCSPRELVRVVEHDPVLTGRILKVVNSAYFGLSRSISSVKEALAFIGLNTLKNVALTVAAIGVLPKRNKAGLDMEAFLAHSLGVGAVGRFVAEKNGLDAREIERCFLSGMLHNFGTVVLAMEMPKVFRRIAVVAQSTNRPDFVVAREMVGMDHFEIGGIVAEKWKLESSIADAIRTHRYVGDDVERTHLMDVLWLSSKLVGELQPPYRHPEALDARLGGTLTLGFDAFVKDLEALAVVVDRVQVFRKV